MPLIVRRHAPHMAYRLLDWPGEKLMGPYISLLKFINIYKTLIYNNIKIQNYI